MTEPGSEVALYGEYTGLEGLQDFDASRMVIPRLTIDHKKACFVDTLANIEYPGKMRMIILGMVFQRILWHVKLGEKGELPMCKSTDGVHGFPTPAELLPTNPTLKRFPWTDQAEGNVVPLADSGFKMSDYPAESGMNGLRTLPCANCRLKEWGSHPMGQKPYCGEMYTMPVMYEPMDSDPGTLLPALFAVRSTGLKPANQYLSKFAATKTPLFTVWTEVSLQVVTSGGNDYCKPAFAQKEQTDRSQWPEFAKTFVGVSNTLRRAPTPQDDIEGDEVTVESSAAPAATGTAPAPAPAPPVQTAAAPASPQAGAAAPAPAAQSEEDDPDALPF